MSQTPNSRTILCVEDELILLEELCDELTEKGYRVLSATNGDEAERILSTEVPDLILCDVMLPGRNGFELLQDLRNSGKLATHTVFFFVTALSEREPHMSGLRAGADGYIKKPVDLDLLHLQIENALAFVSRQGDLPEPAPQRRDVHLSPREEQVLGLLGEGARTVAIAHRLEISEHTVNQYIKELYRKLGLGNRADAARAAIEMGLVSTRRPD